MLYEDDSHCKQTNVMDELLEIKKMLGDVVTVTIEDKPVAVRLVDGEKEFNQLGMSAGFVHFSDPYYSEICLGYGGVATIYNQVKKNDR